MFPRLFLSCPLSDAEAAPWVTPAEVAAAAGFAPVRRSEWLSWRAIVRRELVAATGCAAQEIRIAYDEVGAPVVENSPVHVAVSHCKGSVVVALSDAPCAVDIESLGRNFWRVASRYMTGAEAALCSDPRWPAVLWSAKECLYKYAVRRELDLLRDLRIEQVDFGAGTLVGRIGDGAPLRLCFLFLAGRVVVYLS